MKNLKKHRWFLYSSIILTSLTFSLVSCENDEKEVIVNPVTDYDTPKYVFFFIGDGMSAPQINITEAALNNSQFALKSVAAVGLGELNIQQFPVTGMQTTYAEDRYVTGSAAAATALATGYKTTINTISMNGDRTADLKTMAELAKEQGKKVGIISSVSIDHATPACFYAHTPNRNNYYSIGQALVTSGFDYFAGGGVRWNKYSSDGEVSGLAKDINLFLDPAIKAGYKYVNTRSAFDALTKEDGKVIATLEVFKTSVSANSAALPYIIDLDEQSSENDKITLSDFTKKGIDLLDNDNGFFMMVEGGKIDWACHANDVVASAQNTIELDKAIGYAIDFYKNHPDETLIVVTGDHETGGLALGYAATYYETAFDLLVNQSVSYEVFTEKVLSWAKANPQTMTFENALVEVKADFGLGDASKEMELSEYELRLLKDAFNRSMTGESTYEPEEISVIYGSYDPFTVTITHILNNKAGIDWTTYSHTGTPVPVFAMGQGQYKFSGYYDNTDVAKNIIEIAGYSKVKTE